MSENINSNQSTSVQQELENEGADLKILLLQYLRYWPWFLLSVSICLGASYLYLRYTSSIYSTAAQIKILKDEGGLDLTGLQGSSPLFDMSRINLQNEIEIIKSRRIANKVVDNLSLELSYFKSGDLKSTEIWNNEVPFEVEWSNEKEFKDKSASYDVTFTSLTRFELSDSETDVRKSFNPGDTIEIEENKFIIDFNPNFDNDLNSIINSSFSFTRKDKASAAADLAGKLEIEILGDGSEILDISILGQNQQKNEDILNSLVSQFNEDGVSDKRLVAKRTEEFVIERLAFLVSELDTVESGLVDFKKGNDLITLETSAGEIIAKSNEAELRRYEVLTQIALTESFKEVILSEDAYELLPANIGIDNSNLNAFTESYNQKVIERQRLLVSSTKNNPLIIEADRIMNRLRENMLNTIDGYIKNLTITLDNIQNREQVFDRNFGQLPEQEKQFRVIQRQQAIKEKLYLFLLQKREEAALSNAITAPVIKVVDFAYTQGSPISPKPNVILLAGGVVGFLIPFSILFSLFLLDTRLKSKEQIKIHLPNIPIVGEIPFRKKSLDSVIQKNERTAAAESFRILRTNLNFLSPKDADYEEASRGKVIMVTSTTKGEGKTFISINIATTLAFTSEKVLLIGCDLRNPQIHNYLNLDKNHAGVSNFLYDHSVKFDDLVLKNKMKKSSLDVMLSGEIPPNPAELILSKRYKEMIDAAKAKYDYIVIDTAPTILVTDTSLLSKFADSTLYVTRADYTDLRLLPHIKEYYTEKKLVNMGLVINAIPETGINAYRYGYTYGYAYGYGYGYGYGEAPTKKKFWKFW
jgi:capsular exopolysaccharide synthesis family protein